MSQDDIRDMVKECLNIPVDDNGGIPSFPNFATLETYREDPGMAGDGHVRAWVKSVQLDLWMSSRAGRETAVDALNAVFAEEKIAVVSIEKTYDTNARKFRATYQLEIT